MKTMMFNPYTGKPRDPRDIASDPSGILMLDPDAPVISATPNSQEFKEAERMRLDSEDLEALHMCLDKAEVPRHDSNHKQFSAWGRVLKYAHLSAQSVSAVQPVAKVMGGEISPGKCIIEVLSDEMLPVRTMLYTHPADADAVDAKEKKCS